MFLPSVVKELNKEIQKTTTATHKLHFCIEPLDLDVSTNGWFCVDFSKNETEPTILVLVLKFFFLVVN